MNRNLNERQFVSHLHPKSAPENCFQCHSNAYESAVENGYENGDDHTDEVAQGYVEDRLSSPCHEHKDVWYP